MISQEASKGPGAKEPGNWSQQWANGPGSQKGQDPWTKKASEGPGSWASRPAVHFHPQKETDGGRCPTVAIAVSCRTVPGAMNDGWYWHCLANTLASSPQTDSTSERASRFFVGHRPPCVFLLCNRTWPNLPGLPPPYLHTVSDQILEVGMRLIPGCAIHSHGLGTTPAITMATKPINSLVGIFGSTRTTTVCQQSLPCGYKYQYYVSVQFFISNEGVAIYFGYYWKVH